MSNFYLNFLSVLKTVFVFFKNIKIYKEHELKKTLLPKSNMSRQPINSCYTNHFCKPAQKNQRSDKPVNIYNHPDLKNVIEIIKNKFYFATLKPGTTEPKSVPNVYLFDIDDEFVYNNFYNDFGPLNIACLYKYCNGVNQILRNPEHEHKQIVHFTSTNAEKRANAAYLAASYSVLYLKKSPIEVYQTIANKNTPSLKPFQDASMTSQYTIQLIDCLNALRKASSLGFFNFEDFDVKEYEKYELLKNGDMNWIVPRKFIAFLGPSTEQGSVVHYPEKYVNYFMKNEVVAVIRLNRKAYESSSFTTCGILHYDMFFPDGTVPPKKILKQFLHVAETTRGAIAVHCKAGLGRTGTLIAAYVMKHYRLSAREAIAWLRICRPGSVIGHQQSWLEQMESSLWRDGRRYRLKYHADENLILHHKRGIYSISAKCERKARVKDYLSEENLKRNRSEKLKAYSENALTNTNARCGSAQGGIACTVPTAKVKGPCVNRLLTQGDKLNQIKMTRNS